MTATVLIIEGTYRGETIRNEEFPLLRAYDPVRGYVTVMGNEAQGLRNHSCRVKVMSEDMFAYKGDIPITGGSTAPFNNVITAPLITKSPMQEFFENESEADAMLRIDKSFQHLDEFTEAVIAGIIRGLIVVGPPGIGKSYGVEQILRQSEVLRRLGGAGESYEIIKGAISAPMLYRKLYEFRNADQVLVLDDCDIEDDESLNIIKGALDSCDKRMISWYKNARWLEDDDIPQKFEFKGGIIFLTNNDLANSRGRKAVHLQAIVSRCHYMDLEISSQRDKLLRIKQIVGKGMLDDYDFEIEQHDEIVNYIWKNADHMRELTLRMIQKLADLMQAFPDAWEDFAMTTCMIPSARYAQLLSDVADMADSMCSDEE